ncbi:MAG: serpin family protein [Candidatus Marinimicrobia bacterium]|nr:serpin family protein [Candidatus Neomarinimicrobiota bacterium]
MKNLTLILSIAILLAMNGCSDIVKSKNNKKANDLPQYSIHEIPKSVIESNNGFSLQLFQIINAEDSGENVFISPISVSFALGMTMNGADGVTFEEMKNVLGFSGSDLDEINAAYAALIKELYSVSNGVEFNLANSIWFRNEFSLQEEFKQLNQDYFDAKVEALDFSDAEGTLHTINSWVEEQTENRIKDLLKSLDPNACMFLINAIYFKAAWKYRFDEQYTTESSFIPESGMSFNCNMMNIKSKFQFLQGTDYDAVELPYANENYAMLVLMPKTETIDNFIQIINPDIMKDIQNSFIADSVNISLPKMEIEYEKELNDLLKEMGIQEAFDPNRADFSKMFNEMNDGIWIEKVKQKSFLKVNEEGTEAAAATVVQMNYESVSDEKFICFNRPFLFFILEKQSESILFCGKIVNPVED